MKKITAIIMLITTLSTNINAEVESELVTIPMGQAAPSEAVEQSSTVDIPLAQSPPPKPADSDLKNWVVAGISLAIATVAAVVVTFSQGEEPHGSGR